MNLKKLFLMLTMFVCLTTTAFAQVYVSATNGDDTFGTGSQAQPYRSITKAMSVAPTGSTISVEAGVYNSTVIPTEAVTITLAAARNFSFVGTSVGLNTTVTLTNGFTLNHASAVVNFLTTGTATFDFGTTATALVLSAGTMNIATANVALGSGATLTITDGTLSALPTKGTNLNVIFNGTTAISSTSSFLPSSLGSGTLTVDKASGSLTIDNTSLSLGAINVLVTNVPDVTFGGNVTVAANGDITNASAADLTIGNDVSNTLTMSSTSAGVGQIIVNGGGEVIINSNITYNVRNAGAANTAASSATYAAGNVVALTGASSLTVNGSLTFNNTNIAALNGDNAVRNNVTLSNAGSGSLSIVGSITTPLAGTSFADVTADAPTTNQAYIDVMLSNTGTGSFSTRAAALRGATGTTGVTNNATMTLGQIGDSFSTGYDVLNSGGSAVLTVNANAAFGGDFTTVNAASLTEFKSNSSIDGLVTHAGLMKLNATTLELTGDLAPVLTGAGNIYSVTSATTGSGWLSFSGDDPTVTFTGNLPNIDVASSSTWSNTGNTFYGAFNVSGGGVATIGGVSVVKGDANMTDGDITLGANLTVEGTFNIPQGTFSFGASTLTLVGNFNRTAGTVVAGTGTLAFAGATNQSFVPGTQMNVYNVTVTNSGPYLVNVIANDVVTISGSLIVLNNFTITTGHVDLGTSNIRMQQFGGISARFTNGGRGYSASGVGGIIFEGTGANPAGAGDGAVITGTQPFSNIYIRLSNQANNVLTLGAVNISGVITFDGGGIEVGAADDGGDLFSASTLVLDDALVIPTVVVNTENTHGSPYFVTTAPTVASVYNLTYTGQTNRTMTTAEFITGDVQNLTISAGSAGKTITFIAGNGTIVGNLVVDNGETLQLTNGGARILTASGNTAAHVVNGTVTGGTFEVTGNAASLTGGSGSGNASLIADLLVDPATTGTFTSNGMKTFTTLTINKSGLLSNITMNSASAAITTFANTNGTTMLNMNSSASGIAGNFTVTAGAVTLTMNGAAAGTRTIAGALAVNGGTLTLGSHINVTGAVTQTLAGKIALGDFNLTLANNYTHSGTGTITAGTGALVAGFNVGATVANYTFTTTVDIPNFTLNAAGLGDGIKFVTNGLTVTNKFVHTAGSLDLNSLPFNVSGDTYTYTAGTYLNTGALATGTVSLNGGALTITAAANPSFPYLAVNSTGTVTFATSDNTTPTARTFGVVTRFTHTKGNIDLGINDLDLTGAAALYTTATTAGTVVGSTGTNLGEVVLTGAASVITLLDNYSIQNIRIVGASSKSDSKVLTITDNFTLGANFTFTSSERLALNDGATIIRSAGVFDVVPTFGLTVNVNYTPPGALSTDKEIPASATALNNLTVSTGAGVTTLSANATVNGTLYLTAGTISKGTKTLTIAEGATINRAAGVFGVAATDVPTVTSYNLTYSPTAGAINTAREYVDGGVNVLTIAPVTTSNVTLTEDFTVESFVMNAKTNTPVLSLGGFTLTVNGMTQIQKGTVNTGTIIAMGDLDIAGGLLGAASNITFAGDADQNFTLGAATTINDLTIDQVGNEPVPSVMLTGANLTLTGTLDFVNGLLNVEAQKYVMINNPVGAGQGFTRDVATGNMSHVIGTVRKNIKAGTPTPFGRNEFPVGNSTKYSPVAITIIDATNPGPLGINVDVSYHGEQPTGIVGLPIVNGVENGVDIARYPGFYWNIKSGSSFGNIHFDLELSNEGFNDFSNIRNVRIIRRQGAISDNNNQWSLQGANDQYDNFQSGTFANIVNVGSVGGIRTEGAIFTYGMRTRLSAATLDDIAINQGEDYKVAVPLGEIFSGSLGELTYSASSTNENVATVEVDGDTLWITGVGDGQSEISVRATDVNLDFLTVTFTVSTNPVGVEELGIPTTFALEQNYPNPFNPTTVIRFGLPEQSNVVLRVYNILGQEVATLLNTVKAAGWHEVNFNASQLGSGLYIYRIEAKDFVSIKKMMLVK